MDQNLVKRYNDLKGSVEELKVRLTRAETNLEVARKDAAKYLKEILEQTNSTTFEEAEEKMKKLEKKLEALVNEGEEILNG